MKNFKKITVLVIAVMMLVSSFAMGALATGGTPITSPITENKEIEIEKIYDVQVADNQDVEFTFNVTKVNAPTPAEKDNGLTVKTGPDIAPVTIGFTGNNTVGPKSDKNKIDFGGVATSGVGCYIYKVSEVADKATYPNVNFDTKEYTVKVYVGFDETDGKNKVMQVVSLNAEGTKEPIIFNNNNSQNNKNLTISKTVAGVAGDRDMFFTFSLTADTEVNATITYSNPDGTHVNGPITLGAAPKEITLKHGQTATIGNLPPTVTVTVKEADAEGYTVSTKKTGEATFSDNATKSESVLMDTDKEVAFKNTKGFTTNTGVLLDVAPYVLAVGIVLAAGIIIFIKRRKAEQ